MYHDRYRFEPAQLPEENRISGCYSSNRSNMDYGGVCSDGNVHSNNGNNYSDSHNNNANSKGSMTSNMKDNIHNTRENAISNNPEGKCI